jgi:nucleoside-diphosphate-sugar epimerase
VNRITAAGNIANHIMESIIEKQNEFKDKPSSDIKTIVVAGATGKLGELITHFLILRGVSVIALVRRGTSADKTGELRKAGAVVEEVDFDNVPELAQACLGAACVVSALSGLRDVIVDAQSRLLAAAVKAGVPRFIPSDYCIDYTKLSPGSNRNLDLRREFSDRLDKAPVMATSVLNGMFTDLLAGEAPLILTGPKLVVFWGNADQPLDFTTMSDTAVFTAAAAVDSFTPRYLRIAGEVITPNGLKQAAEVATGDKFRLLRVGGLGVLKTMIGVTRTLFPQKNEVFPAWQGMQYLHNMLSGRPKLHPLDNDRYPEIRWTRVREVLARLK